MKSVFENLEAVLLHIAGLYTRLVEEGERKRTAIIEGDVQLLEEVVAVEYEVLEAIEKAEKVRKALTEQAARSCGIPEENKPVKISCFIALLGDKAAGLKKAQNTLKEVLTKFRFRNRQNEELLKASIEHVNSFLSMIKNRAGVNKTYNRKGYGNGGGLSILDRRA